MRTAGPVDLRARPGRLPVAIADGADGRATSTSADGRGLPPRPDRGPHLQPPADLLHPGNCGPGSRVEGHRHPRRHRTISRTPAELAHPAPGPGGRSGWPSRSSTPANSAEDAVRHLDWTRWDAATSTIGSTASASCASTRLPAPPGSTIPPPRLPAHHRPNPAVCTTPVTGWVEVAAVGMSAEEGCCHRRGLAGIAGPGSPGANTWTSLPVIAAWTQPRVDRGREVDITPRRSRRPGDDKQPPGPYPQRPHLARCATMSGAAGTVRAAGIDCLFRGEIRFDLPRPLRAGHAARCPPSRSTTWTRSRAQSI